MTHFKIGLKQDSVIRLLLNVEMLQPALSKWLLEKIALLAIQAEDENDQFLQPSQGDFFHHKITLTLTKFK